MAQFLLLAGSVLRIFTSVLVPLLSKKSTTQICVKFGFFLYYQCAPCKNIYEPADICHWLVFTGVCGLSLSKTNLDPIPWAKRNTAKPCFCTCVIHAGCCHTERHCADCMQEGQAGWASLPGAGLTQVAAAEDLPCSISGVLFCSSDNSTMKGHDLFLPCTLCSSILPPSLLFPESLTWD